MSPGFLAWPLDDFIENSAGETAHLSRERMGLDLNLVHLRCLGHSSGCLVAYGGAPSLGPGPAQEDSAKDGTSDRHLRVGGAGGGGVACISVSQSSVHGHQVPGSGDVSACETPAFCLCSGDMSRAGHELLGRKAVPAT